MVTCGGGENSELENPELRGRELDSGAETWMGGGASLRVMLLGGEDEDEDEDAAGVEIARFVSMPMIPDCWGSIVVACVEFVSLSFLEKEERGGVSVSVCCCCVRFRLRVLYDSGIGILYLTDIRLRTSIL